MNAFKNLGYAFILLALLAESSSVFAQTPPTINQCRGRWVLTTLQDMNFGGFAAEGGSATLTMNSTGGLSPSGPVTPSSTIPSTAWTVSVNNTRSPLCATYGFTIELRRAPQALRGPGGAGNELPLDNVRATIPAYGLNNVALNIGNTILPQVIAPSPVNAAPFTMTIYGAITVNGPQPAGEYSRNLVVQIEQGNRQRRGRTSVQATSIVPLSIAEIAIMDFGTIAGGPVPGTVILSTGNARTPSGDVQLLASGPGSAATFQLTGEPNNSYSLSFSNGVLANAGGQQMGVTSFTNNSSGTIPGSGTASFQVGATLNVGSNQPAGAYSTAIGGGSPYTVTINYN
jgi:hypothetical protein